MRKTPKNSAECFHWWANAVRDEGRSGNVWFRGEVLYSYREPIARLVNDNLVLVTSRKFSITTSSHCSSALAAARPREYMRVPHVGIYGLAHSDNKRYWEDELTQLATQFRNHPRRKSLLQLMESTRSSYNRYRERFQLDWPDLDLGEIQKRIDEEAKRLEETRERLRLQAKEQRKQRVAEEAAEIEAWRCHNSDRRSWATTALRLSIDGTEIETTHGARVPVSVATRLWTAAGSCREHNKFWIPNIKFTVSHYTLDRIDADGTLRIGCHTIPWDELVIMAKQLNLKEYSDEVCKIAA